MTEPGANNTSSPSSSTSAPAVDSSLDPFETAIDNFKLAKLMSGITSDSEVNDKMYDKLLGELLVVFVCVETVVSLWGWRVE